MGLQDDALLEEALSSSDSGSGSGSNESGGSSNEKERSKEEAQPVRNVDTIVVQGDSYVSGWGTEGKQLVALYQEEDAPDTACPG